MRKDFSCPYSILGDDIVCEHKSARIDVPSTVTLHNHDGYELVLFLNGDVSLFVESVEKKLVRGDLVIVPPYTFHGLNLTGLGENEIADYERIILNLKPGILNVISDSKTDLSKYLKDESSSRYSLIHIDASELDNFVRLLDKLEAALKDGRFGCTLMSKAVLTEFIISLEHYSHHNAPVEFQNSMSHVVTDIFRCIDDNLSNELSVDIISEMLHHNTDYIGRVFKKATGVSLKHYINAKKISLAQQYLRQGYAPSDVCFMVGYVNYSSFSRLFSAQIGVSPKKYQQAEAFSHSFRRTAHTPNTSVR